MRVDVDFSIFCPLQTAAGRMSGILEFSVVPRVGELISFDFSNNSGLASCILGAGFDGQLKVKQVLHSACGDKVSLSLDNLSLDDPSSLQAVVNYLEHDFGLFFEPYSE